MDRRMFAIAALTAFVIGTGSSIGHASYVTEVLADNPVAYYRLNEATSAVTAANSSAAGAALNGTYNYNGTGAGPGVAGAQPGFEVGNSALQSWLSDGNVARVVVDDSNPLDVAGALTLEAWVYRTPQSADANENEGIVTKYVGTGNQRSFALFYSSASGTLGFAVSPDGTSTSAVFHSPAEATIPENQWTHIAAVFVPGSSMNFFVNGQAVGTPTTTGVPGGIHVGTAELWIGGLPTLVSRRMFEGNIDEVAVYSAALSPARILAHYNAAVPEPGSVALMIAGLASAVVVYRKRIR